MITKRSKGYVPYLYTRIKYKSKTVHIKTKTGEVIKSQYQKKLFTLIMFTRN